MRHHQHIGAYQVKAEGDKLIIYRYTRTRSLYRNRVRGSKITDIVVLVVTDDGIKPQTVEAIKHAKAAKVQLL